jgi:formate dehydrogenase major subunit
MSRLPLQVCDDILVALFLLNFTMDRRAFLRRSGLGVGVALRPRSSLWSRSPSGRRRQGGPGRQQGRGARTVCTHCSVGCAVDAVVENGVWVRQEPVFDSPINLGAHCAKGAALREHGHGEYRLRYPMKLVNGKYQRISWDTALNEITAKMLELRKASGPTACTSSARPSTTTSRPTCCASS